MSARSKRPKIDRVRELPLDDVRNISHPGHKEQWLELARALGRMDARKDFEAIHGKPPGEPRYDYRRKTKDR